MNEKIKGGYKIDALAYFVASFIEGRCYKREGE